MKIVNNRAGRLAVLATASAVGLGALATSPASAGTATSGSATATGPDVVSVGQSIHIEGTGFTSPAGVGDGGSVIAVKFDDGDLSPTEDVLNPTTGTTRDDVWAIVEAEPDGSFEVDLPFPTVANSSAEDVAADEGGIADGWAADETHNIRLLTGSMLAGDTGRSLSLPFTTSASPVLVTASNGGRGADPAQVTLAATASAGSFDAAESVAVTVDGEETDWTSGGTSAADGSLGRSTIVYAPGDLRAGPHEVTLTGAGGATFSSVVETTPTFSFSSLTLGSTGALSVANLPEGSTITDLEFGDVVFTGLPMAAEANSGKATVPYTVPADAALGTQDVVLTLSDPAATFTSTAKLSPSTAPVNTDGFEVVTTEPGEIAQGLYQSAYSPTEDALFATTAYSTTATDTDPTSGWDGLIYKLDPTTLEVIDTVRPGFVSGEAGARFAAYGIGVDDEHNTVWVTNTRQNTVAVYDAETLDLVKQFEADIVDHTREVIIDPETDQAFVSAASRGADGATGVIGVFSTGDTAEEITQLEDIEVTTEAGEQFVPMALDLDAEAGKLYTVNLRAAEAAEIDTTTGEARLIPLPADAAVSASGVAFDEETDRLYIASQGTDNLLIVDVTDGSVVNNVPTGSGALSVEIDDENDLVYTANFTGGSTISVTDLDGDAVATLPLASPNHVSSDGMGSIFAVNKAADNQVVRITPVAEEPEPELKVLKSSKPKLRGTLRVGGKVRVIVGKWTPGTKLSVQWLANGKAIKGAKRGTLKVTKKLKGKRLKAVVTGKKAGYETKSVRSITTKKVKPAVKKKNKGKKNKKRR